MHADPDPRPADAATAAGNAGGRTLADLTAHVLRHRDERDWAQFHTPKELAVSLAVEAGELLALMQWKTGDDLRDALAKRHEQVRDELADVLHSVLLLANDLGVDLPDALERKLAKDARKYPVEKSRGRAEKYTEL
jgi:NTP pyrophosphatase (non-canonical NTP hydrolase)